MAGQEQGVVDGGLGEAGAALIFAHHVLHPPVAVFQGGFHGFHPGRAVAQRGQLAGFVHGNIQGIAGADGGQLGQALVTGNQAVHLRRADAARLQQPGQGVAGRHGDLDPLLLVGRLRRRADVGDRLSAFLSDQLLAGRRLGQVQRLQTFRTGFSGFRGQGDQPHRDHQRPGENQMGAGETARGTAEGG